MARDIRSPAQWVQVLQALVARELVDHIGLPVRRAADVLGIAPSAVSQYISGKRRQVPVDRLAPDDPAVVEARTLATKLAQGTHPGSSSARLLLEAAARLADGLREGSATPKPGGARRAPDRELARQLKLRISAEQGSVSQCMSLAQKARDELTRAIFRQIASDSLRHAEIVASIANHLEQGVSRTLASGITREDIERLIESERMAEAQTSVYIQKHLGGVMALLAHSMRADERKHDELLSGLLKYGFGENGERAKHAG